MPAMYLPIILMLLALVFRGVAFEFRWVARTSKIWWDRAFWLGSTLAAFFQGVILGGLIQGITVANGEFAGGPFDWATRFSVMCGLGRGGGLCAARGDLAADQDGRRGGRARARAGQVAAARRAGLHGPREPLDPDRQRAHRPALVLAPNILYLWPVPLVTALLAWACWRWLEAGREVLPFLAAIGLFLLGYLGLVISWYPYLVPPSLTVWDTAAVPASQIFSLIGVLIMLPIIIGYFVFVYWLFRGKVREGEGYH